MLLKTFCETELSGLQISHSDVAYLAIIIS